jgi:iron complex transport system permease protein
MSNSTVVEQYHGVVRRRLVFILATFAILFITAVVSLTTGPIELTGAEVLAVLLGSGEPVATRVIWHIRLPRIVAAVGAGCGLAVAGAAIQSVLRNPLGSPYTLGISQAAAFGAAFGIVVLGSGTSADSGALISVTNPYLTAIAAFTGSLFSTTVILGIAKFKRATPETMVLTGIALAALFTAGTTALEFFATNTELATIVFWKFGDVSGTTWRVNAIVWTVSILGAVYFVRKAWAYNVLDAGDETASSLGVDVDRVRMIGMLVASLMTAVIVSFFGIIGFIGLVVPHIVRRIIGGDERFLLPASFVAGGALLLVADTLARTIVSPIVLPVGIVTSFVGVPLFVYLILKGRAYW